MAGQGPWFPRGPLRLSSSELPKAVNRSTKRLRRLHAGPDSGLYTRRRRTAERLHSHLRLDHIGGTGRRTDANCRLWDVFYCTKTISNK